MTDLAMDQTLENVSASGLDDVVSAHTALSMVDGAAGELVIAGLPVEKLAEKVGFEGAAARLWAAAGMANVPDEAVLCRRLGQARLAAAAHLDGLMAVTERLSVIEGLRAGISLLADSDETLLPQERLLGAMPVFLAALCRQKAGQRWIGPDAGLGTAEDFLRMLNGAKPSEAARKGLDAYLVTVSDHGMNASTFTARVVASTRAGMISAVVAAICALKGPLHGGAPGPVLDMLDEIGGDQGIAPWLKGTLEKGERLMGFGHRVYKVRDPRAEVFNAAVARLAPESERLQFARKVEEATLAALRAAKPDRVIETNMEYYTAILLEALGLPREAFTGVFAMGRTAGWTAHIIEQERVGRLIRPQSIYVGPLLDG